VNDGDFAAPNNFAFDRLIELRMEGTRSAYVKNGYAFNETGATPEGPSVPILFPDDEVYNTALAKMYEQYRGGLDLAIDLLEGGQTVNMLRSANRLIEHAKKLKRGDLKAAYKAYVSGSDRVRKALQNAGSAWLQWVYGMKPLAQDLYDAVLETVHSVPPSLIANGKAQDQKKLDDTISISGYPARRIYDQSWRCEIQCRFVMGDGWYDTAQRYTSMNPVSMLWETLPYTFVLDWIVDIGGYLRNFESAALSLTGFLDGWVTETCKSNGSTFVNYTINNLPNNFTAVTWTGGGEYILYSRSKLTSSPFPRQPSIKIDMGAGRLLNAAALLSNFLGVGDHLWHYPRKR
jgi:hypothetical protein